MDFIFSFILGFCIGAIGILVSYGLVFRKKKYGFKDKVSFEYNNHIKKEILDYDTEQHSNK